MWPIIFATFCIWWMWKDTKHANRQSRGIRLDCDMSAKFRELLDDPTMNDEKWKEWLPVFEFADTEVKRLAPRLANSLGNHGKYVRSRILDLPGS